MTDGILLAEMQRDRDLRLVADDRVVAAQLTVALHLGEQDAVGHHLDERVAAALVGEAHLVADGGPELDARAPRRALGDRPRRDAPRLGVADAPSSPRPSSRQIFGIWVVLPDPVSPATTTTWWSRSAAAMSSRRSTTGRCSGYLSRAEIDHVDALDGPGS